MQTKQSGLSIRIVSYNILSDSLCTADHFNHSNPDDLNNDIRFKRITMKLQEEINKKSIICLQEVSRSWKIKLVKFLKNNQYAHFDSLYGSRFNGYMGVFMAWPNDKLILEKSKNERIAESVKWGDPKTFPYENPIPNTTQSSVSSWWSISSFIHSVKFYISSFFYPSEQTTNLLSSSSSSLLPSSFPRPSGRVVFKWDSWEEAARRENCAVMVRLTDRVTKKRFVVSTYHMPCLFGSDEKCQVMVAHIALLMQSAQRFAGKDPLIVAGDFNMQPDSIPYELAIKGTLSEDHPQHPPMPAPIVAPRSLPWNVKFHPMRSAYVVANGEEPNFTNFAWSAFDSRNAFKGTLDYIFISDEWKVSTVKSLKDIIDNVNENGFPSLTEPSDHVLIASDLSLS